jgi:hypothetical protein
MTLANTPLASMASVGHGPMHLECRVWNNRFVTRESRMRVIASVRSHRKTTLGEVSTKQIHTRQTSQDRMLYDLVYTCR